MTDEEWNAIRPGAPEAKRRGCLCPVKQPFHKHHHAYFQREDCRLHQAHKFPSMGFVKPEKVT